MTKLTTAAPIWTKKLAAPRERMPPHILRSGYKFLARSLIGTPFVMMKYHSTEMHEHACPHTVARALPRTPQPSTMTNK